MEIGGPDVLSYGDMMRTYARLRGLRRLMIPVPVLTPRLSSYWVNLVSPVPAGIARPLIEGLRNEVVVREPGPAARVRPAAPAIRRGTPAGHRPHRPARRRIDVVRRAGCPRQGEPLVAHVPRGDDRRAPAASRRRTTRAGVRRDRAGRRRRRLAVRERPVAHPGLGGSRRRRRRDATGPSRSRAPAGRGCARLLARGGGPSADPAAPAGGDEGARAGPGSSTR